MKVIVKINGIFWTAELGRPSMKDGYFSRPFSLGRKASKVEVACLKSRHHEAPAHTSWCVLPAWSRKDGQYIGRERIPSLPVTGDAIA